MFDLNRLHELMDGLAGSRPIFHSEADFQHEFAWATRKWSENNQLNLDVRLERPHPKDRSKAIDIVLQMKETKKIVGSIELKYSKHVLTDNIFGEEFDLKTHGAQNQRRYDVWKDVQRVEEAVMENPESNFGAVIFLTNDHVYWKQPNSGTQDREFSLKTPIKVSPGMLQWRGEPSSKEADAKVVATKIKRQQSSIKIENSYDPEWRLYGEKAVSEYNTLKYLIFFHAK